MQIYQVYFSGAAALYEVNCGRSQCAEVHHKIENDDIDETLFDSLKRTVITNLTDTFSRFLCTAAYEKYVENQNFNKELIEGKK